MLIMQSQTNHSNTSYRFFNKAKDCCPQMQSSVTAETACTLSPITMSTLIIAMKGDKSGCHGPCLLPEDKLSSPTEISTIQPECTIEVCNFPMPNRVRTQKT